MTEPHAEQESLIGRAHVSAETFEKCAAAIATLIRERAQHAKSERSLRWQEEIISREIPVGGSVLDLGCGDGFLLERLIRERNVRGQGVEIDAEQVFSCVDRGVPVIQADLGSGLAWCPDKAFDVVVLEETLQTLQNPREVLEEMLRVGKRGIV
jgi:ubiquinone/menaquinone biosynthesis C-methylase UbiE